jgi:hypothetical protein
MICAKDTPLLPHLPHTFILSIFYPFKLHIQPSKWMGAFQYNPSNGWVNFKLPHWRPIAWGDNKSEKIFGI